MPSRLASARSGSLHRHQIPTPAVLSEMQSRQTETFAQDLSSTDSTVVCRRLISRGPHTLCFIDLRTRYAHRVCSVSTVCAIKTSSERLRSQTSILAVAAGSGTVVVGLVMT